MPVCVCLCVCVSLCVSVCVPVCVPVCAVSIQSFSSMSSAYAQQCTYMYKLVSQSLTVPASNIDSLPTLCLQSFYIVPQHHSSGPAE